MVQSYKDLIVWQKSAKLAKLVYVLTQKFPKEEVFGLTSQMRRCAVSIPSNIAEGRSRDSRKDFAHFLKISHGSASELETQLFLAKDLSFGNKADYDEIELLLSEVLRMLNAMIPKLAEKK